MDMSPITESVLLEYFNGELDDVRKAEVEQWIAQSDANAKLAKDIYYIVYASDTLQTMRQVDTAKAFISVKRRMFRSKMLSYVRGFERVAAVLFVAVVVYSLCFNRDAMSDDFTYVEIASNTGMVTSVMLPDSTKVWLNSNSRLKYPTRFTGSRRDVELYGEAYFKVTKDAKRKFTVKTGNMRVEVLGTEFNVDAYTDVRPDIRTTLVTGSINLLFEDRDSKTHRIKLRPDDCATLNLQTKTVNVASVDASIAESWRNGKILLNHTKLEDALRMIENRYNVKFRVANPKLYENTFTGMFVDQRLDVILKHFEKSSNIRFNRAVSSSNVMTDKETIEVY